jgi:hypothetical protein
MEWVFGRLDRRQLTLRFFSPSSMQAFTDRGFVFSWWKALRPRNWWKAATGYSAWEFSWRFRRESNHRCYCPVGNICDGSLAICSFQMNWWYSRYTGEIQCWCDKAIAQLEVECWRSTEGDQCEPSHSC